MPDPQIITPSEARARGLARYFTGKPCKGGLLPEVWLSPLRKEG